MKQIEQPEATVHFTLANGVKLRVDAHARLIRNSDRVDAKIIGIDWETITTNLCLDIQSNGSIPGYIELLSACLDDHDSLSYLDEESALVAVALGSIDYAETIKNAIFHARGKVLALNPNGGQ